LVLAINGYGLAQLGYWMCLAWSRLGLVINPLGLGYGCAWLGAAWLWRLLAWCRLAIGCDWLSGAWAFRLGLAINLLGLGYGRLGLAMAVLGLVPLGLDY
jgi:hypothetical protein